MRLVLLLALIPLLASPVEGRRHRRRMRAPTPTNAYEVEILGIENRALLARLCEASLLLSEQKKPISSFPALQYRAESDRERMLEVLRSYGYYAAQVLVRYEREAQPSRVMLLIYEGPLFPLASFSLVPPTIEEDPWEGMRYPLDTIRPDQLGLRIGGPAVAEEILDAEKRAIEIMKRCGWPLAKIVDQEAVVDLAAQDVNVTTTVDSGPQCRFGPLTIEGLRRTKRRYITQCLGWRRGQIYNNKCINQTIYFLRRSGLFRSIRVIHDREALLDGELPMTIAVEERKPRTIGLGVSYNIEQGIGPLAEWEHRNLWGMGETLGVQVTTGQRRQEIATYFRRPHFLHCNQDLLLNLQFTHDNQPAYRAYSVLANAIIDRVLNKHWAYAYGIEFEQLSTQKNDNNGDYTLLSVPMNLRLVTVDDLLDASRGFRIRLSVHPFANFVEKEALRRRSDVRFFSKNKLTGAVYYPLMRDKRIILAAWATFGSILGSSDAEIPAPKRFYAGSDQTLRGYSYQKVGPLGRGNRPLGGRSLMIYGIEPRFKLNDDWGFAVFYEIGNVFESKWPRFDQKLLSSVGFGPRYYTAIGPLSVDIAFPINRRPGVDSWFQVYLNIGQPF